jgi:TRAP-type C4-dicarboxylate transport system permease small subunit
MNSYFTRFVRKTSAIMHVISAIAICAMVLMTCLDVVLRRLGTGVAYPFEIVCALAGIVMAFGLPQTSLSGTHVAVDYLKDKLSSRRFRIVYICTRCLGILLFLIMSWNAARLGNHFHQVNQQSAVLQIPEFFFPYFLAVGSFVTCIVLFHSILSSADGGRP